MKTFLSAKIWSGQPLAELRLTSFVSINSQNMTLLPGSDSLPCWPWSYFWQIGPYHSRWVSKNVSLAAYITKPELTPYTTWSFYWFLLFACLFVEYPQNLCKWCLIYHMNNVQWIFTNQFHSIRNSTSSSSITFLVFFTISLNIRFLIKNLQLNLHLLKDDKDHN